MYFVLKILKIFIYIIQLYMFRTPLRPSSGASQLHIQSLVQCGAWFVVSSSPTVLQHSRTGGHNEPSTTRDQRLHVQLRRSWWWTQWCPKHVERYNVNKILRILRQSTSSWHVIQSYSWPCSQDVPLVPLLTHFNAICSVPFAIFTQSCCLLSVGLFLGMLQFSFNPKLISMPSPFPRLLHFLFPYTQ